MYSSFHFFLYTGFAHCIYFYSTFILHSVCKAWKAFSAIFIQNKNLFIKYFSKLKCILEEKVAPVVQHDRECPGGWVQFEGYCYLVVNNTAVWDKAENNCISKGGHLASIHSDSENNFIQSLHSSTSLWIGGTVETNEVGFTYLHNLQRSRVLRLGAFLKGRFCTWLIVLEPLLGVPCSTRDSLGKVLATSHNSTSHAQSSPCGDSIKFSTTVTILVEINMSTANAVTSYVLNIVKYWMLKEFVTKWLLVTMTN
jgi:hypothetical protein